MGIIHWTSLELPPEGEVAATEEALGVSLPLSFLPYVGEECWTDDPDHEICIQIQKPLHSFNDHPFLSIDGFYDLSDLPFEYQARMDEDPALLLSKPKIVTIGYDSGRGRFHLFYDSPEPSVIWFSEDDASSELFTQDGQLDESRVIRVRPRFQEFINDLFTQSIYD